MSALTEKEFTGILQAFENISNNASKKNKKISAITPPKDLASRLREAMAGKGITQRQLSKRTGMATSAINQKINGKSEFSLREAFLIAEILQKPFDELFFKYPY